METIQDIRNQLEALVTTAHRVACSIDIGVDRTEAFELYEALRRLQRRGAASEMLAATNPLLNFPCEDGEEDEDWDEDD
ncbi:hypothetical protein [Kosakonia sp. CFBP8986]|uniref:hypothetical protein n=1 Tax=Kosakonia sp. CFBP8986 TaxID=3096524 RepID=UPI002A6B63F1|nr:hypothetical protein [Kosakonia sp. CFBP8986]MDY0886321.1 hypothetical protein [Kosakonia sp. CFBP8986]